MDITFSRLKKSFCLIISGLQITCLEICKFTKDEHFLNKYKACCNTDLQTCTEVTTLFLKIEYLHICLHKF